MSVAKNMWVALPTSSLSRVEASPWEAGRALAIGISQPSLQLDVAGVLIETTAAEMSGVPSFYPPSICREEFLAHSEDTADPCSDHLHYSWLTR